MFKALKKQLKPEPEPKRLYFPKEKIRKLLTLYDDYTSAPKNKDSLKKYDLWAYIVEIFPEVADGGWRVQPKNGIAPYVEKIQE